MKVFLLHHEHELNGNDDAKLIGVYASEQEAELAKERASKLSGFRDSTDGFSIGEYTVGQDYWTTGFITELWTAQDVGSDADKAA